MVPSCRVGCLQNTSIKKIPFLVLQRKERYSSAVVVGALTPCAPAISCMHTSQHTRNRGGGLQKSKKSGISGAACMDKKRGAFSGPQSHHSAFGRALQPGHRKTSQQT